MANVPVAGFPTSFPSYGQSTLSFKWSGLKELSRTFDWMVGAWPKAEAALLTELGMYGITQTKLRTPVDFGPLRASIGQYRGEEVESPKTAAEAKDAAHFAVLPGRVEWGSNLNYASHVEFGFTMGERRLVYIERVGFRWVNPFSYRGAHMFHLGLAATAAAAPKIGARNLDAYWRKALRST